MGKTTIETDHDILSELKIIAIQKKVSLKDLVKQILITFISKYKHKMEKVR